MCQHLHLRDRAGSPQARPRTAPGPCAVSDVSTLGSLRSLRLARPALAAAEQSRRSVSDVSTGAGLRCWPPSPAAQRRSVSDVSTGASPGAFWKPRSLPAAGACQTCQHPRNPVRAEEGRDRRSRAVSKHAEENCPSRRCFRLRLQHLLRANGQAQAPTAAPAAPRSRNPRRRLPPPNGSAPPPGRRRRNRGAG